MILDKLLQVSTEQAITTTAVSTDTIDLGTARDVGAGEDSYMVFTVKEVFAGGTSVIFNIITSDNADLSSGTVLAASAAQLTAALVVGKQVVLRLPAQIDSTGKRYLGASYTVSGTYTAGKVDADITLDLQDGKKYYGSGYTV